MICVQPSTSATTLEGAAGKSYGIHVARLAGVPDSVISRARVILEQLEEDHLDDTGQPRVPPRQTSRQESRQLSLFEPEEHPLLRELGELELDEMTPIAALVKLHDLRTKLQGTEAGGSPKPAAPRALAGPAGDDPTGE